MRPGACVAFSRDKKPLSIPLSFDDAMRRAVKVKPEPKDPSKARKAKNKPAEQPKKK